MINAVTAMISTIAASIAAIAAVIIILVNRQQVKVSQEQVKVSQKQISDQYRPLLLPHHLSSKEEAEARSDLDYLITQFDIKNAGLGVALNIRGVIFGPKTLDPNDQKKHGNNLWFSMPLSPENNMPIKRRTVGLEMNGDWTIGKSFRYTLYPPTLTEQEIKQGKQPVLKRLTLTYHDIFGQKHASIFDLTHLYSWECVEIVPNILNDLDDLVNKAR